MACNYLGDEWFTDSLGQPVSDRHVIHECSFHHMSMLQYVIPPTQVQKARTTWHYKGDDGSKQVAGFIKEFTNLTFITIKVSHFLGFSDN